MGKEKQYTKKARLIDNLLLLTEAEKFEVKKFFNKYPVYESKIDWNNRDLHYTDFLKVFELAERSAKNSKRKAKKNPLTLFLNCNCNIIAQMEDFIITIPLDWECMVYFNSFGCGGSGARWCIGDKKTSEHWDTSIIKGENFFFIFFLETDTIFGKKIIIQYADNLYRIWLADDTPFWWGINYINDISKLIYTVFGINEQNMLKELLINKQYFFNFGIFKENYDSDDQIRSYMKIVTILHLVNEVKHFTNTNSICRNQLGIYTLFQMLNKVGLQLIEEEGLIRPRVDCSVNELFELISMYYFLFTNGIGITSKNFIDLYEAFDFIYKKGSEADRNRCLSEIKLLEAAYKENCCR
ncbi:hypothetical protein [Treponema primitia]|uniref:hypothetical protein n=1 Tax=Treponema primitia TaxID=88058 RepID=UPI0002555410|nr:hypothetical protein [Treponema primitia]